MLDVSTRAKLLRRLDEAEDALHRLQIGGMAKVYVDQNGERVEYASANSNKLIGYIAGLKAQLGMTTGQGPMTAWFK